MLGTSDLDDQQVSPDVRFMMRAMKGEFRGGQNGSEGGTDGDNEEEVIRNPERGRHRGGVNRVIEGSDDDMGKIMMAIPKFQGKNDPEAYLECVTKVERVLECHRADRTRNGEDPIASWWQLKSMMRRRFVRSWYQQELYQ
nr:RNA-binding protein 25-like [Ipomoea batatas]